jgi:guanylate kinase
MLIVGKNKGFCIVLSSPSAAGKSSIARALVEIDDNIKLSISATTRPPRVGETDGIDYYFKSTEEFKSLIQNNSLLEYTNIYNNYYGTPKKQVEEFLQKGNNVLFDIDLPGAKSIKQALPDSVTIFILPPSLTILKQRIQNRKQNSEEEMVLRMALAAKEVKHSSYYDYLVVNEDFKITLETIQSIIIAERSKRTRMDLDKLLEEVLK